MMMSKVYAGHIHPVGVAACLTLVLFVAVAPGVVDARLSLSAGKDNNNKTTTFRGNSASRSLLSHLRGNTGPSGWEWSLNSGGNGGGDGGFILPFLLSTMPSTPTLDAAARTTSFSTATRTEDRTVTETADEREVDSEYEAYNRDLQARMEAAVLDIFASILRLFGLAFEPLWRAMSLDFGLGWTPPSSPAPTSAWASLLTPGSTSSSPFFQGETEEGDTILPADVDNVDEDKVTERTPQESGTIAAMAGGGEQESQKEETTLGEVQDDGVATTSSPFKLYSAFFRNRDDRL